jgi:spore maturation protein CgeB
LRIVVLGLSVTSTWGNGHGTTFRALLRALHRRGHSIFFFEKDVEWYASNRDLPEPDFCEVRLFENWQQILPEVRRQLDHADVAMVGSYFPHGVDAINEMLDSSADLKTFYDIDTPITLSGLRERGRTDYVEARQLPGLDIYFSFTGGPTLSELRRRFGVRQPVPLYCSFDPQEYRPFGVNREFACDLSYMGTYAPDRQPKIEEFLIAPAERLTGKTFIVAGPQYPAEVRWPKNIRHIKHLNPQWHAEFYSSSRFTLNVTRRDMVMAGYSPSVRLFEAAACGACVISDSWPGLDHFFASGKEILLPAGSGDVMRYLTELNQDEVRCIGERAQLRVMAEHTSERRAQQFETAVAGTVATSRGPATASAKF